MSGVSFQNIILRYFQLKEIAEFLLSWTVIYKKLSMTSAVSTLMKLTSICILTPALFNSTLLKWNDVFGQSQVFFYSIPCKTWSKCITTKCLIGQKTLWKQSLCFSARFGCFWQLFLYFEWRKKGRTIEKWKMKNILYGKADKKLNEAFLYFKSQIHFKISITKLCW